MENSNELIGILQAISIVAKNLSDKLMRIDRCGIPTNMTKTNPLSDINSEVV